MPPFSDLRSDYPLNFTLFAYLKMDAFKSPFRAMPSPADSANLDSAITDKAWFISSPLALAVQPCSHRIPDADASNPHFTPFETPARFAPASCSPVNDPSALYSTPALAQSTLSLAQIWRRVVGQLASPAKQHCTRSCGNIGLHFRELMTSLRSQKSAQPTVVDVGMLSTLRRHSDEQLPHSLDRLGAHRRGKWEVSWYKLAASFPLSQASDCGLLEVDARHSLDRSALPLSHERACAVHGILVVIPPTRYMARCRVYTQCRPPYVGATKTEISRKGAHHAA
jgi:hypothetical protein